MHTNRRKITAKERELMRRCIVLLLGSLLFFFMAAVRAMSGEFGSYQPVEDTWDFPEDDDYAHISAADQKRSARLRRRMVGNKPIYYHRKASQKGDSVTILINERTSSEITSSNDLKRDTSNNMTLTNWLTPKLSGGGLGVTQHGEAAGGSTPTLSYSNNRGHKSDSTIERSQSLTTTITGKVLEVYPNGHLVIEARKSVNVNGEEQTVSLTGIVNPDHMDSSSGIRAEYIMEMVVRYSGKGPMSRMDKRGWGSKIIDFVNPF